jgi:hypothetical protein
MRCRQELRTEVFLESAAFANAQRAYGAAADLFELHHKDVSRDGCL